MWVGSDRYPLSMLTWNTLWILDRFGGNASLYARGPTRSNTSYGPMYLGLNLPFFPNLITPFHGETFKNTLSPTS
ncbi:unnamed protein product [Linum tenue]|uniref:Uncharacterized protein n=1 Tax=Linum tenue TaxID=586396 RepID=A0AAV0S070_9ROSI|nr:unnamed protein product [Linum tenue]